MRPRSRQDEVSWILYRQRILPEQLARARDRLKQLEAEAVKYGMTDLVQA